MSEAELLNRLEAVANGSFNGHFTVMKFTTNWRVGFGTSTGRCDIDRMWPGNTNPHIE
jgi:hypothetical protein